MSKYDIKNAILDLGFLDGCIRANAGDDLPILESLFQAINDLESEVVAGNFDSKMLIYNLGFIRGTVWMMPMPGAYSLAIDRLMEFFVEGAVDWYQLPQPFTGREHEDPVLSDDLRDDLNADYACEGREYAVESAKMAGFSDDHIIDRIVSPKCRDRSTWANFKFAAQQVDPAVTSTAAAEQSEESTRAEAGAVAVSTVANDRRSAYQSISDDRVDEIRRLSETMTDEEIAIHLSTSRDTVLRFRKKHGVEKEKGPRYGCGRANYEWEPWQKQKLIEMKQAGHSYGEIAKAVGKTASQCSGMWHWEKKKLDKAAEQQTSGAPDVEHDTEQPDDATRESSEIGSGEAGADETESEETTATYEGDLASRRITVALHGYAAKREDGMLRDEDWPDIKARLAQGDSRRAIASDYEAELEDLDFFIASCQRREAKQPPGEARAPLVG